MTSAQTARFARRRIRVHLTRRARALERDLIAAARAANAAATEGLTDSEITTYLHLTSQVIDNLQTDAGR
jgi:DNA-binding MarR family transcriptional regulator